jgi:acyl-CoA thioesterase-1
MNRMSIGSHRAAAAVSAIVFAVSGMSGLVLSASQSIDASPGVNSSLTAGPRGLSVLTVGDSIMKGFGVAPGQAWPSLIANDDGWSLTNVACDGAGVLRVGSANDCDENFAALINSEAMLDPDIVIFEGSSNDFGLNNSELLASTFSELQAIRAEFPSAQIIGLSTLWGYTDPPAQLAQINSQVQRAVTQVGGTYVNVGQPMAGHPELMQSSDVHPNAAGQAVLASTIRAGIQPIEHDALVAKQIAATRQAAVDALLHQGRLL